VRDRLDGELALEAARHPVFSGSPRRHLEPVTGEEIGE
jgi:hypothetical protein